MTRAFITGITGQDGSYLAEQLLAKGYEVHGLVRRSSNFNTARIDHVLDRLKLHHGDVLDQTSLYRAMMLARPDEIYHLAAQSHVRVSFDVPEATCMATGMGVLHILQIAHEIWPDARIYNAGSSEVFGNTDTPQRETTPLSPRSPYGCAKAFGMHLAKVYREAYGMYVVSGILFNHESERRGETFVTRKITRAVGRIVAGTQQKLILGNLDAARDWGYAPEYMDAAWRMLQETTPRDYVIGTGRCHTVRMFVEAAFARVGRDWKDHVELDKRYERPAEIEYLLADATMAQQLLAWRPEVNFDQLVARMVDHDVALAKHEAR